MSNSTNQAKVFITDMNGRKIKDIEIVLVKPGNNVLQISGLDISEGIYFCHLEMDGEHLLKKIMIRK
jgi:hypothetical protein